MTKEKQLLLKDLSARLPYHIKCKIWLKDGTTEEGPLDLEHNYGNVLQDAFYYNKIKDIKPYLRPMSSMTVEEGERLEQIAKETLGDFMFEAEEDGDAIYHMDKWKTLSPAMFDYLNSIHIDYRGLIEKGLALEAPEGMYKTN